jgi:hypothetical protein
MWYYGRDAEFDRAVNLPSGRCGMAVSDDGVNWKRVKGPLTRGAVLEPSPAGENSFDNAHVGVSGVYRENGLYWMWFFGGSQEAEEFTTPAGVIKAKGLNMVPGCAISRDGLNWVKLKGPHSGAFLQRGRPGEWDRLMCSWPRVLKDDSGYKMFYHSLQMPERTFTIGMAVSADGFHWTKRGKILGHGDKGCFDEKGVSCRHVLKVGDRYLLFYEGMNSAGYYGIGLAVSDDGLAWHKDEKGADPGGPVFLHAPKGSGRFDAQAVGTPCVVPLGDGSFHMYYVGCPEAGQDELTAMHFIGLAVSDGPDYRKWRRWGE